MKSPGKEGEGHGRAGRRENSKQDGGSEGGAQEKRIVRLLKPVVFNETTARELDTNVIASHYYGSFNYSIMPEGTSDVKLSVGVTSANASEGKTLVACNLAVSLALSHQKETVLVDLNAAHPRVHEIFGAPLRPGILDSLHGEAVYVTRTSIKGLSIVVAGDLRVGGLEAQRYSAAPRSAAASRGRQSLQLEMVSFFRDVIYSLQEEFEYVVVDLPAMNTPSAPVMFANQLDGIVVVVDVGKTKIDDIEKMFRKINERQVQGFIFNRTSEEGH